jgi:hypothetical protein
MLTLLWPDPNRHGSTTPEPAATAEEGRAIVNLATTIVQWALTGSSPGDDGRVGRGRVAHLTGGAAAGVVRIEVSPAVLYSLRYRDQPTGF